MLIRLEAPKYLSAAGYRVFPSGSLFIYAFLYDICLFFHNIEKITNFDRFLWF